MKNFNHITENTDFRIQYNKSMVIAYVTIILLAAIIIATSVNSIMDKTVSTINCGQLVNCTLIKK